MEVHAGDETPLSFGVLSSPAYRVSGIVSGVPKGVPIAEITLSSQGHGEFEQQQLEEGGRFDFQNVLPGSYTATIIVVTGLFSSGKPGMQGMRLSEPIEVSNQNLEGLRLQPSPAGDVRGQFRMDTHQKFDWTQLTVMLLPQELNESGFVMARSFSPPTMSGVNGDGSFDLKNVPAGSYD